MLTLPRGRKVGPAIFDRRNQELTHGLISYYSPVLTGPTGLQLLDLGGQDNHSTLTGMDALTDWVDSPYGKVLDFDGVDDVVIAGPHYSVGGRFSFVSWVNFALATGLRWIAGKTDFNQNKRSWHFYWSSANTRWELGTSANGTAASICLYAAPDTIITGEWVQIGFVYDSAAAAGARVRFFKNGSPLSTSAITEASFVPFVNDVPIAFFASRSNGSYSNFLQGQSAEYALWDRALTPSEIQVLYRLQPGGLGRRLRDGFFLYETAIAYSLEASTASYALTGQPMPLLYGRSLPADTGSVLLSGQTTSLLTSRLLSADQGSYACSGTDAATLLGRLLDAGAAAYTLDGNAAGFTASRRISADTVAYLASGLDAGFLRSRVLEAGTGQYVLVASPVNITTGTGGAAPYYYLFLLGGSR